MQKILFLLIFLLLSMATTQAQISNDTYNPLAIEHDGIERLAHVYEPDGEITGAMIALHPFFSSGRAMEAISGLNTIADERGWVMIYPESLEPYWDDGRFAAGLPPANSAVDDVGYLATLSDTLRENYEIDTVYLTGLAIGGTMAMRAICETPEKYDGVAIVNALMWSYQEQYCTANENPAIMDMLFIKGSDDHIYWTEGRPINNAQWVILSARDTVNIWSSRNTCGEFIASEVTRSVLATADCADDTQIAYLPVINGGNNWSKSGENTLNNRGIDTARVIAAFLAGDDDWETLTAQPEIPEDNPRSYIVYVPTSYDPSTPTPVVISLHGRGANNFSQAASSGFNAVAEEHGFIVVYPQAYDPNFNNPQLADAVWNYNLDTPLMALAHDDDAFLDAVVDDLALVLNVDMNRLYVNGLSNGGYMTNRLACTRGDRYAAFAAVAANAPFGIGEHCQDGVHAPIMLYHGTADTISPWEGAQVTPAGMTQPIYILAPIPNTLAFWVNQNGCEQDYQQTALPNTDPDSRIIFASYTNCPDDSAVEIYAVVGGGHVWHGVQDFDNDFVGEVNMDINASEAIWAFYSQFTLDGRDESVTNTIVTGEPNVTGFGVPEFPLTLAEMQNQSQEEPSPETQVITALQSGGFTIYFALDLAEPFDCEANSPDEAIFSQMTNNHDAFTRIGVTIGTISTLDDCRAVEAGSAFADDAVTFSGDDLASALLTAPEEGTVNIVIGDAQQISTELGLDVAAGQSVLMQSTGDAYTPLAVVPDNGWTTLADNYESN